MLSAAADFRPASAPLAMLLTLFNVRLGWWLRNPRWERTWSDGGARLSLRELLSELLGMTTDERDWVYLSDGGHFDNTGVYALNADFRLSMPQQLQDAINHGTPVSFQVEFRINRPRWYWSNENLVSTSREQRISFNSLTREYRVNSGVNQYRYNTLNGNYKLLTQDNPGNVMRWPALP